MKVLCIAVAVLILVAEIAESGTFQKETAAQRIYKILQNVRRKDRNEFIRYHLHKGYELAQQKESTRYPGFNYEIDEDDSVLFYHYFSTYNQVTDEDVAKVARNIICWKDKCIDFSDPGIHP